MLKEPLKSIRHRNALSYLCFELKWSILFHMRIFCNKISELKKTICALPCLFKYFAPFTCAICSFAYKVLRCPLNVFEASECYRRLKMFLIYLFFGYFTLTVGYGE